MAMTDPEIITLSIVQEGRANVSERSFQRRVKLDDRHLFPNRVSRSRSRLGGTYPVEREGVPRALHRRDVFFAARQQDDQEAHGPIQGAVKPARYSLAWG
jgi:hypothetical protein